MKKVSFLVIFIAILFSSCKSKTIPDIFGNWNSELTLKSELAAPDATESVVAYLYTKQNINITFSDDKTFTKTVKQIVEKVDFVNPKDNSPDAKDFYSKYFNKNLVFEGDYIQTGNNIVFTVLFVRNEGEEPLPYSTFFSKDPSIGEEEFASYYEVLDGKLVIDGVSYKKSE